MDRRARTQTLVVILALVLLLVEPALSLIMVGGDEPIEDHGWPTGSVVMANLPTRVSWWAGPPFGTGSMYEFQYKCSDTEQFNQALQIFAAIQAPKLQIVVRNGPKDNPHGRGEESKSIDWTFTVWNPESWDRLYNSPRSFFRSDHPNFRKPVAAPKLDVYIGGGGTIIWKNVRVPENVVAIDKRPGSVSPEFTGSGLIHGKVFDMVTGQPMGGAQITLVKHEGHGKWKEVMHGKTNDWGFCQISRIVPGYYEVRVGAEGYVPRKQGSYNNTRPEYHKFEIGLTRPSCARGIVVDQLGNPIPGVKVSATNTLGPDGFGYPCVDERSTITNEQGQFEICSLPKGLMSIRCRKESLHVKNSIFEQYEIPTDQIKLVMTGTGTVFGKVVGRDGNRPAGGIVLELEPEGGSKPGTWGYSGHLSADGTFKISGIPPGRYVISTRPNPGPADYEPNVGRVTIKAGKTYEVEILHEDQRDKLLNVIRKFIERRLKNER